MLHQLLRLLQKLSELCRSIGAARKLKEQAACGRVGVG